MNDEKQLQELKLGMDREPIQKCKNKDGRRVYQGGVCRKCWDEFWEAAAIFD